MAAPRTVIVDFESYYSKKDKYTLSHLGTPGYILDPRFKVFGMAVDVDGHQHWIEPERIPAALKRLEHDVIVAHNGFFDFAVLQWHYKFRPAYMTDTLALASHVFGSARDGVGHRNDLASLADRLGLEAKGTEIHNMDGIRDPDEAQLAALAAYAKRDARIERGVLDKLLPQVSNPDFELWLLDHTLRIYLERQLPIDADKAAATLVKIAARRDELVTLGGVEATVLASNKQFAAELERRLAAVKQSLPVKKSPRTGKIAPALSKQDAAFIKLAEHDEPAVANLIKARLVVRSAANATARLNTMLAFAKLGLGIPVHLNYYGAHTGRFSGGGGFNFQNFTNPDRATDPTEREIASMIRDVISAGEGMVFVACDAAQIEARVLAWLAGEQSILDAFATGADLYSQFISGVLSEDIHKPTDAEAKANPEAAKHLKLMRHVGKEAVLGLGYSMGTDKFAINLQAKSRDVAKMFEAGKLTSEFVMGVVRSYREQYTQIVGYWSRLEKAFHSARNGAVRVLGPLTFRRVDNRAVGIELPSGRVLYYRDIRSEKRTSGTRRKPRYDGHDELEWKHGAGQKIYGGLLAENITQAVARDILANSIFEAEVHAWPVALHIHDEIVCRVPEAKGQECLDFLTTALSTPPEWGQGLVLGAEGKVSKTLSK